MKKRRCGMSEEKVVVEMPAVVVVEMVDGKPGRVLVRVVSARGVLVAELELLADAGEKVIEAELAPEQERVLEDAPGKECAQENAG
jgi:hypothetical protein